MTLQSIQSMRGHVAAVIMPLKEVRPRGNRDHSTLIVFCQVHEWEVHGSIICHRCPVFTACLIRKFRVNSAAFTVSPNVADMSAWEADKGRIGLQDEVHTAIGLSVYHLHCHHPPHVGL